MISTNSLLIRSLVLCLLIFAVGIESRTATGQTRYERMREQMVQDAVIAAGVTDERVLRAMRATERHEFVPRSVREQAYVDGALPIGASQTISSPFIVAYMTESIDPQPEDRVLEIGTGSGYQAAILSPLVKDVYTIEIVENLGRTAERRLQQLGYDNVHVRIGDGFLGWEEHAPFDKIIATCSPEKVPQPLVDQLAEGGLMVIPVGERYQQTLYLFRKVDGELKSESLRPTLFVPMTGKAEDAREVQPDPLNPEIVNNDFEAGLDDDGFVKGWYYQRVLEWVTDEDAPSGEHYIRFENEIKGRAAHLMQVFAVDGRAVRVLKLSADVRTDWIEFGDEDFEMPFVGVSFYDENRRDLGGEFLGPFRMYEDWHNASRDIRVPQGAREAILRVGLFGATGQIDFDNVKVEKAERRQPVE